MVISQPFLIWSIWNWIWSPSFGGNCCHTFSVAHQIWKSLSWKRWVSEEHTYFSRKVLDIHFKWMKCIIMILAHTSVLWRIRGRRHCTQCCKKRLMFDDILLAFIYLFIFISFFADRTIWMYALHCWCVTGLWGNMKKKYTLVSCFCWRWYILGS